MNYAERKRLKQKQNQKAKGTMKDLQKLLKEEKKQTHLLDFC
jgi:hypothetical protein